ncbi:MAG TPA: hypothetical protein VMF66_15775 [Candidatus Acidoferrum sp.]|nr:hypothetical protein [Candidatus Acidoferrum sp.]
MKLALIVGVIFTAGLSASAQKLQVKVINRQDNQTDYTYVVPAESFSNSNGNVDCNGDNDYTNCSGSSRTTTTTTPAQEVSYRVSGATFSLLLPDGRVAVVNCESKFVERFAAPAGNHRSCRVPLVDNLEADFHADKAKLIWVVSLDGKKKASETYKVLAILGQPKGGGK